MATKHDLDQLEQRLRADVRADLYGALNIAITSQTRALLFTLIGSQATMAALVFAAANVR